MNSTFRPTVNPHEDGPMWYNWAMFRQWDEIWKEAARDVYPNLKVLDVRDLSVERRDAHPGLVYGKMDCLHFCLPGGPVDAWNQIMYNEIL